tara:strand:+ start:70632 stop:71756 length:1125 start_codon:yes stop_codon:yes gene_type:complete
MTKNKFKVLTILGTRPEIIRLSRILPAFDKHFNHKIFHTGQNYDENLSNIFFNDLSLRRPDYYLQYTSTNNIRTISKILVETDKILKEFKPDAIFVLGDTNSSLSSIVAKKKQIPIFHYEAGNRCFDERVPEEANRRIVDTISDINITYSKISRQHLIREGLSSNRVINIGSPMFEVISYYKHKIKNSRILNNLSLKKNKYFLISCHREENVENKKNFRNLVKIIKYLNDNFNYKIVISVHPRIKDKINKINRKNLKNVLFSKPFSFSDYLNLQINSKIVLSDSGTINEEASILDLKAINIRSSHERPEADEEAVTLLTGLDLERVSRAINYFTENRISKKNIVEDYNNKIVSIKLVKILMSHIGFVNENHYKK